MKITEATTRFIKYLKNIRNASPYTIRNYERSLNLLIETMGEDAEIADLDLE